ncbi:MAG: tetratricopeptide repeat protein, partial [Nitrosomonas sp.]|nr:tetratricopeptide repeat protein [Nitrosomonas sp.]
ASSLNNLSNRLAENGKRAEGLAAIERAVAIREQLAADNFAAYGPALAGSLNNLSNRLSDAGRRAEGLAAIERAVAIREQLAADNFAAYGPDLASSLNNLSNRLGESAEPTAEQVKRLMEIRAQLQLIKRRIRDEHIQVPAHLAWLLESDPEAE